MAAADPGSVGRIIIADDASDMVSWEIEDNFFAGRNEWAEVRAILHKYNIGINALTPDPTLKNKLKITNSAADGEPLKLTLPGKLLELGDLPEHCTVAADINRYLRRKGERDWHSNFFKKYDVDADIDGAIFARGGVPKFRGKNVWQVVYLPAFNHAYNCILEAFPIRPDSTQGSLEMREAAFLNLRVAFLDGIREAAKREPQMLESGRSTGTFLKLLEGTRITGEAVSGLDLIVDQEIRASFDAQMNLGPKGALKSLRNACSDAAMSQPASFHYGVACSDKQLLAANTLNVDLVKLNEVYSLTADVMDYQPSSTAGDQRSYEHINPVKPAVTYVTYQRREQFAELKHAAISKLWTLQAADKASFRALKVPGASDYFLYMQDTAARGGSGAEAWFTKRQELVRKFKSSISTNYGSLQSMDVLYQADDITDEDLFDAVEYELLTLPEANAWRSVTEKRHYTRRAFQYEMVHERRSYNVSRGDNHNYVHETVLDRETAALYKIKVPTKRISFMQGSCEDPERAREANRMMAVLSSDAAFAYRRRPTRSRMSGATKAGITYSVTDNEGAELSALLHATMGNSGDRLQNTDKVKQLFSTVKTSALYRGLNPVCWTELVPHADLGDIDTELPEPHKFSHARHVEMCFRPGMLEHAYKAFKRKAPSGLLTNVRFMTALRQQAVAAHRLQKLMFVCEQMLHAFDVGGDDVEQLVPDMLGIICTEFKACQDLLTVSHEQLELCVTGSSRVAAARVATAARIENPLSGLLRSSKTFRQSVQNWAGHFEQRSRLSRNTNDKCMAAYDSLKGFADTAASKARREERSSTAANALLLSLVAVSEMDIQGDCTTARDWDEKIKKMFGQVQVWYARHQTAAASWAVSDITFSDDLSSNDITVMLGRVATTWVVRDMLRFRTDCAADKGGTVQFYDYGCTLRTGRSATPPAIPVADPVAIMAAAAVTSAVANQDDRYYDAHQQTGQGHSPRVTGEEDEVRVVGVLTRPRRLSSPTSVLGLFSRLAANANSETECMMKSLERRLAMSVKLSVGQVDNGTIYSGKIIEKKDASSDDLLALINAHASTYNGEDRAWQYAKTQFPFTREDLKPNAGGHVVCESADRHNYEASFHSHQTLVISPDIIRYEMGYGSEDKTPLREIAERLANARLQLDNFIGIVGYKNNGKGKANSDRRRARLAGENALNLPHNIVDKFYDGEHTHVVLPTKSHDIEGGEKALFVGVALAACEVYDKLTAAQEGIKRCEEVLAAVQSGERQGGIEGSDIQWSQTSLNVAVSIEAADLVAGHPAIPTAASGKIEDLEAVFEAIDGCIHRAASLASDEADYLYLPVRSDVKNLVVQLKARKEAVEHDIEELLAKGSGNDDGSNCTIIRLKEAGATHRGERLKCEGHQTRRATLEHTRIAYEDAQQAVANESVEEKAETSSRDELVAATPKTFAVCKSQLETRLTSELGDKAGSKKAKMELLARWSKKGSDEPPVIMGTAYYLLRQLEKMTLGHGILQLSYKSMNVKMSAVKKLVQFHLGGDGGSSLALDSYEYSALMDHGITICTTQRLYDISQAFSETVYLDGNNQFARVAIVPEGIAEEGSVIIGGGGGAAMVPG